MSDDENPHALQLEWGCITNLVDKVSSLEDKIEGGWPELIDMVADLMTDGARCKDPAQVFFYLYGFLFRLYYRIKVKLEKRSFNIYAHEEWGTSKEDVYTISNYDYKVFKWAVESGFSDRMDNERVLIPAEKLTTSQRRVFDKRCSSERKAL